MSHPPEATVSTPARILSVFGPQIMMRSWPPGGATLISALPFDQSTSASRLSIRRRSLGPRLGLAQCVGQALPTEAIAECIRSGSVGEAESNMGLLCLVPTPATADWDASVTLESIDL